MSIKRFLLFCIAFGAELCARRILYEQDVRQSKDAHLSYLETAQSALYSSNAALHIWQKRD